MPFILLPLDMPKVQFFLSAFFLILLMIKQMFHTVRHGPGFYIVFNLYCNISYFFPLFILGKTMNDSTTKSRIQINGVKIYGQ
jgi:hypothetical protein